MFTRKVALKYGNSVIVSCRSCGVEARVIPDIPLSTLIILDKCILAKGVAGMAFDPGHLMIVQ